MGYSRILGPVSGGVSSWNDLTDKPSTFAPSSHTHPQSQVTAVEADLAGRFDLIQAHGLDPVCLVSGGGESHTGLELTVESGVYLDEDGTRTSFAETVLDFTGQANGEYIVSVAGGTVAYAVWTGQLPAAGELPLYWVTKGTSTLSSVVETANLLVTPGTSGRTAFTPGPFRDLVKISSGTYQNGIKFDPVAGAQWDPYFGLPLAWACAERDPEFGQLCCERCLSMWNNVADVSKVPAAYGTTTWLALHGTTHAGAGDPGGFNPSYWPWRVTTPEGTPVIVRADSHDSYAAWLVIAMVRLGRADTTWWDANFAVLKEIVYYNLLLPMQNVGGGYLTSVFQDTAVYGYCLTGDNCEVWRALTELSNWIAEHANGTQTTWATTNNLAAAITNVANGLHSAWDASDPADQFLNWFYEIGVGWGGNDHDRFYPELWVYLMPLLFRAPLYQGAVDALTKWNARMERITVCLDRIAANAPYAGRSGRYNTVFGYSAMWAAAFASIGMFDESRRCSEHWTRHHLRDGTFRYAGSFDVAWILYAMDCVSGIRPDAMGEWFA